ncbi:hypothetical protein RND71_015337 [Anisodus tanguticus]|uniref:Uncharacterized protein n=1 Tax=Anisodus tanguticus TaxID=243964 RepID=A0AAE1S6Q8_9SOLA|nr:hypothetical protein RND71_015337 [Anisodus tanguticus]
MAKAIVLLSALCIVTLANFAHCNPEVFDVEGKCRNITTETETFSVEGVTDKDGKYKLTVEGDHEDDICEVTVVKSPREDCKETVSGYEKARIECSDNVGMHNAVRYANPLFFMKAQAVEGCKEVLDELGLFPVEL